MAAKSTPRNVDKELVQAKAREQVASRKLARLKERYDKLKTVTDSQYDALVGEREGLNLRLQEALAENEELTQRCKGLGDEAAMWKSQLFEQLDRLDTKHEAFVALQSELAEAQWQMVELVNQERRQCETERALSESRVDELEKSLIAARARVDGLKNLGTCLTAKLDRATAQRKVLQREHARLTELAESRAQQLESKEEELENLRAQLFEARGQILSQRLGSDSWDLLKEGLNAPAEFVSAEFDLALAEAALEFDELALAEVPTESAAEPLPVGWEAAHVITEATVLRKPEGRRQIKLAPLPQASNPVRLTAPFQLFSRASKAVGGWFKLGGEKR